MKNTLILSNNKIWKEMMLFDPLTENKTIIQRTENRCETNGSFEYINKRLVMLYRYKEKLYLALGELTLCLTGGKYRANFLRKDQDIYFSVVQSNDILFEEKYRSFRYDPLNLIDPSFNDYEEENQDFYLFVYNVMQDEDRQAGLYIPTWIE